jgi:sec-independent protein translocase protein TatA
MIGGLSPLHWLLIIAALAIFFGGRGKISSIMGDAAKGIKAFKEGLKDDDTTVKPAPAPLPRTEVPLEREREEVNR